LTSLLQIWPVIGRRFGVLPQTRVESKTKDTTAGENAACGDFP